MYDSASGSELADTIGRSGVSDSHQERPALLKEGEDPECGLLSASLRDSHVPVKGASGDFSLSLQPSLRVRTRPLPASSRRQKFQRQSEVKETLPPPPPRRQVSISQKLPCEAAEKYTLTPAMRKKYLKELFLNNGLHPPNPSYDVSSFSCSVQGDPDNDPDIDPTNEENNNRAFLALDPVEHAWMLSVVDGNYDTIVEFLSEDLNLLTKRDFVTGFTVIHWLAKHGKHETLIHLMRFAESKDFHVNVNLRASGGLTPLHVATMHGQDMIIKILVGAYSADVDARDYNGKKAWQYLKRNASTELRELTGAMDEETGSIGYHNVNNNGTGGAHYSASQNTRDELDCSVNKTETTRFGTFRRRFRSFFSFLNRGQIDSGWSAD
ncbi:Ankyrin repeat domain-containing protein SOWAHC [Acipenser ruthenus]|uniref:Ankyrin repeat domain-containing protein SOWAHC n=1 Tax=Acipenser ruthenus TaxID=7906 RepID=A0A444UTW1_ACIRT|nr:Ankyrin repeat domain-containing protein SOWAHC [Acipenser ruthenus]